MRGALVVALVAALPAGADEADPFGTTMKFGLPLAAAICAADQDRFEDFALRGALQAGLVLGLKTLFDGTPLGMRPTGEGRGFPSGHAAAAGFGAADLAGKCWRDEPALGALAYGAAGATAFTRVGTGQHDARQALTGTLIGVTFGAASFGIGTDSAEFAFGLRF